MATEYGNEFDPYQDSKKPLGVKGDRKVLRNVLEKTTAKPGQTIKVRFPELADDAITPGSAYVTFKLGLTSEAGGNQDLNRTIVNNIGRAIVKAVSIKLQNKEIFSLNNSDIYYCYKDLWKTTKERDRATKQGIQTEAGRKVRINAGDKGSNAGDVAIEKKYGNKFYIPLDFELLSSAAPFFPSGNKGDLEYTLTFNDYGSVIVSSDTNCSYTVSDMELKFGTLDSKELANSLKTKHYGDFTVHFDDVNYVTTTTLNKDQTIWNFNINMAARSLKGILVLFVDTEAGGGGVSYARDSEKFYNPNIKNVSVTIDGHTNQIFPAGMELEDHFDEIRRHFAKNESDVTLADYLTTKYGLWVDFRSNSDNTLSGSGRTIKQFVHMKMEREAETAGDLEAHIYFIRDGMLGFSNQTYIAKKI